MLNNDTAVDYSTQLWEQKNALLEELRHAFIALGVSGNNVEAVRILRRVIEITGKDPEWFKFNQPVGSIK